MNNNLTIPYFPSYFSSKAIGLYFLVLTLTSLYYIDFILPFYFILIGSISVIGFFFFSYKLSIQWYNYPDLLFAKKIFAGAFLLRIAYVFFSYGFYTVMTGEPFEFYTGDAWIYNNQANFWAENTWDISEIIKRYGPSDSGYVIYLSAIKKIFGEAILLTRLIKAFYGALLCYFIFKIAYRNFGSEVARISAIFCMLMPNLIHYTGLHLKEVEMVFLTVWFVERADYLMRSNRVSFGVLIVPFLLAFSLFFFRTILGAVALLSLLFSLTFSSLRIIGPIKRFMLIFIVSGFVIVFLGGRIMSEVEEFWGLKDTNLEQHLEWRAQREGGNRFATYASQSIFVPLILIIPFPTIVNTPGQENIQYFHGGYFIKNILSFFVLIALFTLWKNGLWRQHVFLLSFMLSYLFVVASSGFGHSERFHLPALPFYLIFAAYGVNQFKPRYKFLFTWYLVFLFLAILGWSWFKLAGRDLV